MFSEAETLESTLVSLSKLELHLKGCVPLWDFAIITDMFTCLPNSFGHFTYYTALSLL